MKDRKAFTLIELVMVIVILGILSAVALPTFFNLQNEAKRSAVQGALGGIRSGIAIWYANQAASLGVASFPSLGALTASTNGVMAGGVFPRNPYTNSNTVKPGTSAETDETVGWIYDETTGRLFTSGTALVNSGF